MESAPEPSTIELKDANGNWCFSQRVALIDMSHDQANNSTKASVETTTRKRTSSPITRPTNRRKSEKNEESDDSDDSGLSSTSDASGICYSSEDSLKDTLSTRKLRRRSSRNEDLMTPCHVTVQGVLEKSTIGFALIRNYEKARSLTDDGRKALVQIITAELIANDFIIERNSEFERLAHEIHEIFPNERVDTYYIEPVSADSSLDSKPKRSRGRLVNKFRCEIQKHTLREKISEITKRST